MDKPPVRLKSTGTIVPNHRHSLYWFGKTDCATCKRMVARFELELQAKALAASAFVQTPYFTEWWRMDTGPCIRIELTPYEVGLLRRTGWVLEQLNWLQEGDAVRLRNWHRQYDGALFTNTGHGGIEYRIVLVDASGKFRHQRRYKIYGGDTLIGERRYLTEARRLAQEYEDRRTK